MQSFVVREVQVTQSFVAREGASLISIGSYNTQLYT